MNEWMYWRNELNWINIIIVIACSTIYYPPLHLYYIPFYYIFESINQSVDSFNPCICIYIYLFGSEKFTAEPRILLGIARLYDMMHNSATSIGKREIYTYTYCNNKLIWSRYSAMNAVHKLNWISIILRCISISLVLLFRFYYYYFLLFVEI